MTDFLLLLIIVYTYLVYVHIYFVFSHFFSLKTERLKQHPTWQKYLDKFYIWKAYVYIQDTCKATWHDQPCVTVHKNTYNQYILEYSSKYNKSRLHYVLFLHMKWNKTRLTKRVILTNKEIVGYRALNITEPSTRVLIIQLLNP